MWLANYRFEIHTWHFWLQNMCAIFTAYCSSQDCLSRIRLRVQLWVSLSLCYLELITLLVCVDKCNRARDGYSYAMPCPSVCPSWAAIAYLPAHLPVSCRRPRLRSLVFPQVLRRELRLVCRCADSFFCRLRSAAEPLEWIHYTFQLKFPCFKNISIYSLLDEIGFSDVSSLRMVSFTTLKVSKTSVFLYKCIWASSGLVSEFFSACGHVFFFFFWHASFFFLVKLDILSDWQLQRLDFPTPRVICCWPWWFSDFFD